VAAQSGKAHAADTLKKFVRSEVYASTFQMTQVADHVEVAALVFVDPRGSIPKWVVNYFTRRGARVTLEGLRHQVARKLYPPERLAVMHQRILAYHAFRDAQDGAP